MEEIVLYCKKGFGDNPMIRVHLNIVIKIHSLVWEEPLVSLVIKAINADSVQFLILRD